MDNLAGKTAVITGAASGIGLALARACTAEGMAVALVDLPGDRLAAAERDLAAGGAKVEAHGLDVADGAAMDALAARVRQTLGPVHLLCNNAGIAGVHRWWWKYTAAEWTRMLDVNLRGVINGLQAFLPGMLDEPEGHIVNTASMAGLIPTPMNGPYCAAKFGVVGVSEALSLDLQQYGSRVGVSVLCPGLIDTAIHGDHSASDRLDSVEGAYNEEVAKGLAAGMAPAEAARITLQGVREGRFYILTHPAAMGVIERRFDAIRSGRAPVQPVI